MRQCFSPLSLPRPNGNGPRDRISVPCGKCPACDLNRVEDFKNRALFEFKHSDNAFFITLTYDEENLPFDENLGIATLKKDDYQRFMKRLRKKNEKVRLRYGSYQNNALNRLKLRYIFVGEYGPQNLRPHYHAILFNISIPPEVNQLNYVVNLITDCWTLGNIKIGHVEAGAIDYCVSYILGKRKHATSNQAPFMEASRRPGIGYEYVNKMRDYHNGSGEVLMVHGNVKRRMPRYLSNKIFSDVSREHINQKKKEYAEKREHEIFINEYSGDTNKLMARKYDDQRDALKLVAKKEKNKSKLPRNTQLSMDGIISNTK